MRLIPFLFAALILATPQAWSLQCKEGTFTEENSKENIAESDFIFSGHITEMTPPPELGKNLSEEIFSLYPPPGNPYMTKITFKIDKLYKGKEGTKTLTIYDPMISFFAQGDRGELIKVMDAYKQGAEEREIFFAFDMGNIMPLNVTHQPFYAMNILCFYVSDEHLEQIKKGQYNFYETEKKDNKPREYIDKEESFPNLSALKVWVDKNHPKAEIKKIDFKGEEIISVYEYDPGPIENYGDEDIQQYYLALYHKQKDGSYKRIGEYDAIIKTAGASVSVEGDILRMTADDEGKKHYVDYAVSDLLGQSCLEDEHCLGGHYCLKNDYFKPRGLCSTCADSDPTARPAACR